MKQDILLVQPNIIHNIYGQTRLHYPARLRARVTSLFGKDH